MSIDVSILSAAHDLADARLHRLARALVREGLSVEVVGMGDVRQAPDGVQARSLGEPRLSQRLFVAAALPVLARGRLTLAIEPATAAAVVPIARLRRRPVAVDVYEDYLAVLHDRPWSRGAAMHVGRLVARAATRSARVADLTVVADEQVPPLSARNRLVVRNLPDVSMLPAITDPDAEPRAVYIGDVRRSRGLFHMLNAIRFAPAWFLDVVGPVAPSDQDALDELLSREGNLASRVRFHGRLPPEASWRFARGAWAGLALLDDTPAFRAAMPSKLYEYLACGLPVLASDLPRQARLIDELGAGALVPARGADTQAGQVLQRWSSKPADYARLRTASEAAAARYRVSDAYEDFGGRIMELVLRTRQRRH